MIHVLKNGKFKATNIKSAEQLIEKYKLDHLGAADTLNKEYNKGKDIYCWLSPYHAEIDRKDYMFWGLDPEQELADYYQNREEI